jgi:hypothetical protein
MLSKKPELWSWFRFDSRNAGFDFRKGGDDSYELVIVRKPELDLMQAIFVTFPELDEYPTKDLFIPHLTEPGYWKYHGRRDD